MAEGIITILNYRRGMYAVELTDGSYSVFELLGTNELEAEDIIRGALDEEGGCILFNVTSNEQFDVIIQNTGSSLQMAQKQTFLR
ncbi:hypothetical protein [Mucilaginibacter rubeus]|uniref:hypothetical protein n=1 Tax=Mucilaginibacter rubeus TaxID=2027860 RepID=UPI00166D250F|nr:hypothetical protein [Mucilaginibacter rubeus]GGB20668.1 hypothetical protein GCM10011500_40950 [Mucilaginibacter rubeus]